MDPLTFVIFGLCMTGAAYCAYKIGEKEGINGCLSWLEAEGYITFEE